MKPAYQFIHGVAFKVAPVVLRLGYGASGNNRRGKCVNQLQRHSPRIRRANRKSSKRVHVGEPTHLLKTSRPFIATVLYLLIHAY